MARGGYTSTDSLRRTFVFITIDGIVTDIWESYSLSAGVLSPEGHFDLHCPALPREFEGRGNQQAELDARGLKRGQRVKIYLKTPQSPTPVLVGNYIIDEVDLEEEKDGGASVSVNGINHLAPIIDCDILPSTGLENVTLVDIAKKFLTERMPGQPTPFFTTNDLLIDNAASVVLLTGKPTGTSSLEKFQLDKAALIAATSPKASAKKIASLVQKTIDQVKPHPGETVYQFLSRHARRFGLLVWGTADGKVVIGRPNYDQKPLYTVSMRQNVRGVDNTAQHIARKRSFKHRAAEVHVYGHTNGGDFSRSPIHAIAYDQEVVDAGLWRVLTIQDQNARSKEQAEYRAHLEVAKRKMSGDVIAARMDGHAAEDGAVYAPDTVAHVAWDKGDVNEARYVSARTFSGSKQGTFTHLEIIPNDSIVIEPEDA